MLRRHLAIMITTTALLLGITLLNVAPSKAASTRTNAQSSASCYVLSVHLHGTKPATQQCAATTPAQAKALYAKHTAAHGVTPDTSVNDTCFLADVFLWEDAGAGGNSLCLDGTGIYNLADAWIVWPFSNWSNRVSSLQTQALRSRLYTRPNGGGSSITYDTWTYVNYVGDLWNDRAQSIDVF